jgi:hypothetical protein
LTVAVGSIEGSLRRRSIGVLPSVSRVIHVIDAATGELYRHLTLDPTRDYQPFPDRDPRPTRKPQQPQPK